MVWKQGNTLEKRFETPAFGGDLFLPSPITGGCPTQLEETAFG